MQPNNTSWLKIALIGFLFGGFIVNTLLIRVLLIEVDELKKEVDERALAINVAESLEFAHFKINELQGQFTGTVAIAEAAWDMANPNHKPSELSSFSNFTEEQLDSIWEEHHIR